MRFEIGDRVTIKSESECERFEFWAEGMVKWCGTVMTICGILDDHRYIMEEDSNDGPGYQDGHWHWFDEMIVGLAPEDYAEFDVATLDELNQLLSLS